MKKIVCMILAAVMICSLCATGFAQDGMNGTQNPIGTAGNFTVTYKTNADVEMGTLTYEVGGENALPAVGALSLEFSTFIQRAKQKGNVYVPNDGVLWYEDKEFTKPAAFPNGQKDENYTLYCKLTIGSISAGSVSNGAENKSYADVGGTIQPYLAVSGYYTTGRNDGYDGTKAIFEKKNAEGNWTEVPEEYCTDKSGNTWPNMIYFSSVSDSGTYRMKDVRYTATDNDGNILYYVNAEDTPKDEHIVTIAPVELTITGVTAQNRNCDGTDTVQLTGGALQGILYGDDVSFSLGSGTVADKTAGSGKPVTTNITLTGADAGNYTLKQPENITVTISHTADHTVWHSDENRHWNTCVCGEKMNADSHTGGTATCTKQAACAICDQKYGALLKHELTPAEKVEATCTTDGKEAYYTCEVCGKHFSDAAGQDEIGDLDSYGIIGAAGHSMTHHEAVTATCAAPGNVEYWNCSVCEKSFADKQGTQPLISTEIPAGHKAEKTDRVEPTAATPGNIEYWYCPACGQYFKDKDLTEVIAKEETVLAAIGETTQSNPEQPKNGDAAAANNPKTGDNSNPVLWIVLLIFAGGAVVGRTVYGRRVKHSR